MKQSRTAPKIKKVLCCVVACVFALALTVGLTACNGKQTAQGNTKQASQQKDANKTKGKDSSSKAAAKASVSTGKAAPDFSFTASDGKSGKLSDLKGSPVLVSFWKSSCKPCAKDLAGLARLKKENPSLVVLGVNVGDDEKAFNDFVSKQDKNITWVLDKNADIAGKYPSDGLPYSVLVGKDGKVAQTFKGAGADPFKTFQAAYQKAVK
ncbi:MAG: TlpA family protein disulfide reductase [Coriobacteriales bacterium]|jgi:peroxiredoxin|nr:TlpA family protein disulfide reductase [Coriobacteriales bacterium]